MPYIPTDFPDLTPAQLLREVNAAIVHIMQTGQSYMIGQRKLTRADLKQLRELRSGLQAEIAAATGSAVTVAIFEDR